MKILFATEDYFPERGGLQESIHKLIHWLSVRGHDSAVLVRAKRRDLVRPGTFSKGVAWKLFNRPFLMSDSGFPYPLFRTKTPAESLPKVRRRFNPDILVCVVGATHTFDFARCLCKTAIDLPAVIYIFDIQGASIANEPAFSRSHVVVNAEVIAALIAEQSQGGSPPVIPCIVDAAECLVKSTRKTVLYINPHPRKGVDLAWAIAAAAPGLKFVFQESWLLEESRRNDVIERAKKLKNVEFRSATEHPADIYRDARVLLAPYGPERPRVIDEAQANGIPVVASDVPGLRENVGIGGVLVDPEGPIDAWTSILNRLSDDRAFYEALSSAALKNHQRAEIQPGYLVECFERELRHAIESVRVPSKQENHSI